MNRSTWAGALVGTLLCLTAVAPVSAQLTGVTDRSSITGTTVDWSVVGGVDTPVPGGTVVTVGSRNLMLDLLNGVRSDQFGPCLGWLGNFAPCSKLVYAYDLGETPVSFSFSDYVGGFGLDVASAFQGAYTAQLEVFRDFVSLGTYSVDGVSSDAANGTAAFLGVMSGSVGTDFNRVELRLTSAPANTNGYLAFDGPVVADGSIQEGGFATPEPVTMTLLGTGLLAVGALGKRRRSQAQVQES